jgi:hypothetical protein
MRALPVGKAATGGAGRGSLKGSTALRHHKAIKISMKRIDKI